jgi:hypothetical protein
MKRSEYATLNMPAIVTRYGSARSSPGNVPSASSACAKNISFDRNPFSSGTPAIAPAATIASVAVMGMKRRKPLSRRMSRVPVS